VRIKEREKMKETREDAGKLIQSAVSLSFLSSWKLDDDVAR